MNNKRAIEAICYVSLFAAWFLSGLRMAINLETGILFLAFILSCAVYCFLKNRKYKYIAIVILTVVVTIYRYEFILLYVPVLLLMIMFDFTDDRKDINKIFETCTTSYIVLIAFKIFYIVFLIVAEAENYISGRFGFYAKTAGIIAVFFMLLICGASRKDWKINIKKAKRYRTIYIYALIGILMDVCLLSLKNSSGKLQAAQFDFLSWFVFVLSLMYFRDPFTELIISKINDKTLLFLGIDKQSK